MGWPDGVLAVGPASGGVGDAFGSLVASVQLAGRDVLVRRLGTGTAPAFQACRLAWRLRREIRSAACVHVEFGSNDLGVFWFGLIVVHLRRRGTLVVIHDVPKIALRPATGLLPLRFRLFSVFAYRCLSPLLDGTLRSRLIRRACAVGVLSVDAARSDELRGANVVVIPHGGGEPSPDASSPSEGRYVLFAGHVGPSKGVDVLAHAWAQRASWSPYRLVLAGPGSLDAASDVLSGRPDVDRLGEVGAQEFQKLFAHSAIVVLPYRESSPASGILVRALCEGRCVVATPVPAVTQLLDRHPGCLALVSVGDPEALSSTLRALLDDGALLDDFGRRAAMAAADYDWNGSAKVVTAAYDRLSAG